MFVIKKGLNFFVKNNFFVSVCVVALCMRTAQLLDVKMTLSFIGFIFCSTFLMYNFQRAIKYYQNRSEIQKKDVIKSSKFLSVFFVILALPLVVFFSIQLSFKTILLLIPCFLISLLYPLRIIPVYSEKRSLRELPYLKIFFISAVWAVTTTVVVAVEHSLSLDKNQLLLLFSRLLFVLAITIPFDIRDIKYDEKKLKTLPMLFGINGAKKIAYSCLIIALVLNGFFLEAEKQFILSFMLTAIVACSLIYKSTAFKKGYYYSVFVEGTSILLYLSYFFIS